MIKGGFTFNQLEPYISRALKHKAYDCTVAKMRKLRQHAEGKMPDKLITERRPSESDKIKDYRKSIWVPVTQSTISKVITSLTKIRKSQDWSIKYDINNFPQIISETETLEAYCESNFPVFDDFTTWVFNVCLKTYLLDANAICAIYPRDFSVAANEYLQPFPVLFYSDQVLDFVEKDYAVVLSTDKSKYSTGNIDFSNGKVYYTFTTERIQRWEEKTDNTYDCVIDYEHKLGFLPVFKVGGLFSESMDTLYVYESRISPIAPWLDEAAREYSDLQAEVVLHVHSEKYAYATQDCSTCSGSGKMITAGQPVNCTDCKGQGRVVSGNPFDAVTILPGRADEQPIPTPPIGYVQKSVEIVKIQSERVFGHLYSALSSINMEFLSQVPLNQSGVAKAYDRDELNNFVNSIAKDIVGIMNKCYYIFNEYRYRVILPEKSARDAMRPAIAIPERFDLLNASYLVDELGKAKTMNLNAILQNALQIEYAIKKFSNEPDVRNELQLALNLDPFPGLTEADKLVQLQNGGINKLDYIISCNIYQFIRKAIEEYKENKKQDFANLDYSDSRKIIEGYAQDLLNELSKSKIYLPPIEPNIPPTP